MSDAPLVSKDASSYTAAITDFAWLLVGISVLMLALIGRRIRRRRRAAQLADQLLSEVVKGKDAFRR